MRLTSPNFEMGGDIPKKYTCDGENISPALIFEGVPNTAKSLVLIVEDFDAALEPNGWGKTFDHWLVANIPVSAFGFFEGKVPENSDEITNHFGKTDYGGPCPPSFKHIYTFRLYALEDFIDVDEVSSKEDLLEIMQGKIVDSTLLYAFYGRQ